MSLCNQADAVLVGSSLSAHLGPLLTGKTQNLSFAGGSPVTGLELILKKEGTPRMVFIETNLLHMESDPVVLGDACLPVIKDLRKYFPALQTKYAPICLITGFCRKLTGKGKGGSVISKDEKNPTVFDRELKRHVANGQQLIERSLMDKQLNHIARLIEALQKNGTQCVFVRFPVDSAVAGTPLAKQWNEALLKKFNPDKYEWLKIENDGEYDTTDGIHMTPSSYLKFSKILLERIYKHSKSTFVSKEILH